MDVRYPAYCLADKRFYDSPDRVRPGGGWLDFRDSVRLPPGWQQESDGQWTRVRPPAGGAELPAQGWKIHVSATTENAVAVLECVSRYCFEQRLPFKFLPNSLVFQSRNAKYAPREASGKFITVYPRDVAELERVLRGLDRDLARAPGPYILSDLRWNEGPLYVRYGGFALRFAYAEDGSRTPAIERPDGVLVPDRREPVFTVPEWVEIPKFLADAAAPRVNSEQPVEFPYEITGAFHFSNGGGVYRARRLRDGAELVLKEGRPHAGLDRIGRDAPARLRAEHAAMVALKDIRGVPRVYDYHALGGHEFLAMEHVPGISLQKWITINYLHLREAGEGTTKDYLTSVGHILGQIEETLTAVHDRGYSFNDLQPSNVMIDDDLNVSLIDFEAVQPRNYAGPRALGTPGFAAPPSLKGADGDLYSLNALRLFLYLPLTSVLELCPPQATTLIAAARESLGLDDSITEPLARALAAAGPAASGLRPADPPLAFGSAAGPWDTHTAALVASIRATATPDRRDRLFPGDISQFYDGGGGVAFGAAGVVDTLFTAGEADLDGYIEWLGRDLRSGPLPRLGFYDGMAGICHVLYKMGHSDTALDVYDRIVEESRSLPGTKLYDGLSGIGLTSLDFYRRTGNHSYLDHAVQTGATVEKAIEAGALALGPRTLPADAAPRNGRGNSADNFTGGLLYGWSGPALFMVRLYEVTRDDRWLRAGLAAAHRDLDGCEPLGDGTLQVRNGSRVLPYLATGSAGVALVGDLLLNHRHDDRLAESFESLSRACALEFCIGGGLFNGRAGLTGALRQIARRLDWPDLETRVDHGVQALNLHALSDEHGLVFAGEQNLRASTDLATGSAGVLRLINVLTGRCTELLPFLGPDPWVPARPDPSADAPRPTGEAARQAAESPVASTRERR
ncbi:class III lanthionine synthetase LanKC [Streptomyces sp. A012304]|uniref:class III lanthionine synthetase LanKC n=1 Tax=Streptomyces sp. A012304 TaxID=375446 RepID=UPI002230005A|nr:class III lanthionine synthetase LanKC [Streptomyces sp. A012304]GKQ39448.1 serine/threonine protein kinase [Streptomyces sp. A012304]